MNYKSNLPQYDLTSHFPHVFERPMGQSFGHDVPSDWADKSDDDPVFGIWKRCGSWTRDEAAILAACAKQYRHRPWCDIGANTGMISAQIWKQTVYPVDCVDYMLAHPEFLERFEANVGSARMRVMPFKSTDYFGVAIGLAKYIFAGFVIDGDHDRPQPLIDAENSAKHLTSDGVILFHDFWGEPVQEAVTWLMDHGFKARVYFTPHGVCACWRGDYFVPPDHIPDPNLPDLKARCPNFAFERCV